ncbi:MAG: hypothetical protein WAN48_02705 [Actinomycetes bacterium]
MLVVATVAARLSFVGGVTSAWAAPVSATPDKQIWQTDGRVDAIAYNADASVAYVAGIFHHLCPPTDVSCTATTTDAYAIDYLAAVDVSTGAPITSWRPQPDGEVFALAMANNG